MTQPALTLINPTPDEPAQVVAEEPTLTALEERQNLLAHHVRLRRPRALRWGSLSMGRRAVLGKSRTVLRTLADEGVSPVLVNSPHHAAGPVHHPLPQPLWARSSSSTTLTAIFGSMSHLGLAAVGSLG